MPGSVIGPFTVKTSKRRPGRAGRHSHRHGRDMFSNAAGTVRIANEPRCPTAQKIWVRSTGPSTVVIEATAEGNRPRQQRLPLRPQLRGPLRPEAHPGREGHLEDHRPSDRGVLRPARWSWGRRSPVPPPERRRGSSSKRGADGTRLSPDLVIPAGTPAGDKSTRIQAHPGRIGVHRHRDIRWQHGWHGRGGGRGRAGGDHPRRRQRNGAHHRHLQLHRLAARQEDDRRSGRRTARGDPDPHGVRRQGPDAGLRDPGRDSRG